MKKQRRNRYTAADAQCAPFPRFFGRGANIRIVTPAGDTVQSDPVAYRALSTADKRSLCASILTAC